MSFGSITITTEHHTPLSQDQRMALAEAALSQTPAAFAQNMKEMLGIDVGWVHVASVQPQAPTWQPATGATLITGDLEVEGNILVNSAEPSDDTFLVVLGSVRCRNLVVSDGATFLCAGALTAQEAIVCTAMDSTTEVAGPVTAQLLDSGQGAWMAVAAGEQIAGVQHLSSYVMVNDRPFSAEEEADLTQLLIADVLETEEWDDMDEDDREGEDMADYVRMDARKAFDVLAEGGSILA